jgi:DNA replication and repair protein RecF
MPGKNLFLGDNGVGKTNLLEIVNFLSTFSSFRTCEDSDLIRFGEAFFIVSGNYGDTEVEVRYRDKKEVLINGIKKRRLRDSFGMIPVVSLTSNDIEIVDGSPGCRRRFINIGVSFYDKVYIDVLSSYNRALKQRNSSLSRAKMGKSIKGIEIWEEQLSNYALTIVKSRKDYLDKLVEHAAPVFDSLTGLKMQILYKKGGNYSNLNMQFKKMRKREIERGYTLNGPHRDDIIFIIDGHNAKVTASFGVKRALTVSLRIAQAQILHEERNEEPIIILDEIIGELDKDRIYSLSTLLDDYKQVLIATTREDVQESGDFNVYKIENKNGAPIIRKGIKKIHSI